MKYLIVGLGNIGQEYTNTRHNIGFDILDTLAGSSGISFKDKRYGFYTEIRHRGRTYCLLKPSTYVNLSGNAVRFYLKKLKLTDDRLLVVADDMVLPFGTIRMRPRGSDAGHNGIAHIIQVLGTAEFARLRFGIGNGFSRGRQVDFVLGEWDEEERKSLPKRINLAAEAILSFGVLGIERTMNLYNNK
ncbi:MAG: aminoacyl-tRNA hydrolase [Bacteroidales bacterium]|nr:aminoacyl-tRNA hydrolase [Bacteroidales bacterium]